VIFPLRFVIAPALFVAAGLAACSRTPAVAPAPHTAEIAVGGMTCTGCEGAIGSTLLALEGVATCTASFEKSQVIVSYDPTLMDSARLTDAIRALGYDVPPKTDTHADAANTQSK